MELDTQRLVLATGTADLVRHAFVDAEGHRVRLTAREAELLACLARRAPDAADREQLLVELWGHHRLSLSRAVDACVARLRRKIERDAAAPRVLLTVHGHGYRLVLGEAPPPPDEPDTPPRPPLRLGDRAVDLVVGRVEGPDGEARLTARERLLLEELLRSAPGWVGIERLSRALGSPGRHGAVSNLVYRLRRKLEPDPSAPRFLLSRRGHGYRLRAEVGPASAVADAERWQALRCVVEHVGILGFEDCVVYVRRGDAFEQVAAWGPKRAADGSVREPLRQQAGEGIVGACIASGDVVRVDDTRDDPRYVVDHVRARSELAVPIRVGETVVGVLDSECTRPARYTEYDEVVFISLATIASAAFPSSPGGPS